MNTANQLNKETSPYLLQHAKNPVNWYAWNSETLAIAKQTNKMLLISIGYSACHWCHVMEHECFEDAKVAALMNEHFINIKVDREERPDLDQIYMQAVQLMTGQGGWPLNCFALPDGRPIYGGTYFPKEKWTNVLQNLANAYANDYERVLEYAERLTQGVVENANFFVKEKRRINNSSEQLHNLVQNWEQRFDFENGGTLNAPKFPLPNNYLFLLSYAAHFKNTKLLSYVELTLTKMAFGGINDQIYGGFARYSTDIYWKLPHFEKMLYDNAQLISLYSCAYHLNPNELFRETVYATHRFAQQELKSTAALYYSALDADTDGEEGKYYVWTKAELELILKEDYALFASYFNVNESGHWEHDRYILLRTKTIADYCLQEHLDVKIVAHKIEKCKAALLLHRYQRKAPGLDDKQLVSWNGLMIKGYCDAYRAFGDVIFMQSAELAATFILENCFSDNGAIFHNYKSSTASINGFLEDYAFFIEALLALYQSTYEEKWMHHADRCMDYAIQHFYSDETSFFYFTSNLDAALISRHTEIADNVIPSSNSSIANSLFTLSCAFLREDYLEISMKMLQRIMPAAIEYGSSYSNWALLQLKMEHQHAEVVVCGKGATEIARDFDKKLMVTPLVFASNNFSELPIFKNKQRQNETLIYICKNNTCLAPVNTINEAMQQLKND